MSPGLKALIEAGYANTVANSSIDALSLEAVVALERDWSAHDGVEEASDLGTSRDQDALADIIGYAMTRLDQARIRVNNVVESGTMKFNLFLICKLN